MMSSHNYCKSSAKFWKKNTLFINSAKNSRLARPSASAIRRDVGQQNCVKRSAKFTIVWLNNKFTSKYFLKQSFTRYKLWYIQVHPQSARSCSTTPPASRWPDGFWNDKFGPETAESIHVLSEFPLNMQALCSLDLLLGSVTMSSIPSSEYATAIMGRRHCKSHIGFWQKPAYPRFVTGAQTGHSILSLHTY